MAGRVTSDVFTAQTKVNDRQGDILEKMKALSKEASDPNVTQKRLTQIQLELDDLKRNYDVMKSINETLKGVQESGAKFPQAR